MKNYDCMELENPAIIEKNRLKARATVIPSKKEDVFYRNKEESEMILSLNGDYKFCYTTDDITDFFKHDFDDSEWNILPVPSMWQYHGYGMPAYPNVEYPFAFDPPYIPNNNPIGYYRKFFTITERSEKTILHFEGVDNCFCVYVNGEFAGFAKNARIATEFDVSDLVSNGENLIAVKVFTYSDASYLENQDMLLVNGIFRDVYLICSDNISIWDYNVITDCNSLLLKVFFDYKGQKDISLVAKLGNEEKWLDIDKNEAELKFEIINPKLWSAESPNLYKLTLKLLEDNRLVEIHTKMVGLRTCEVKNGRLYLNGEPIRIKGINRHEHNPKTGRTISVGQIRDELLLLKENNINAVRCSHYPNDPAFYEYATEFGLYVADEADIETHGCEVSGDQGYLSKDKNWEKAYLDRTERMVRRDFNETCIIIWSIGNECGQGENLKKCSDYLKSLDDVKPILQAQDDAFNPAISDFRQCGYCPLSKLLEFNDDHEKPMIMTEYAHAMGNGPGGLKDYWDIVYHNGNMVGGFVWEFKNHGFYAEDENKKCMYLYGGDFNDSNHWSNFTLDGYVFSDGSKKPSMDELKEVYAPVWLEDGEKITIYNTNAFLDLSYLKLNWELAEDYIVIDKGSFMMPSVMPRRKKIIEIPYKNFEAKKGAQYCVNMKFYDGERLVSTKQHILNISKEKDCFKPLTTDFSVEQTKNRVTVVSEGWEIVINNGMLEKYRGEKGTVIERPAKICVYRAPTDNDGIENLFRRRIEDWNKWFLYDMSYNVRSTEVIKKDDVVIIKTSGKIMPVGRFIGFKTSINYYIYKDGVFLTEMEAEPFGNMPDCLPRIGFVFDINSKYENVGWYGRGFQENYPDKTLSTPFGYYESKVSDMNVIYEVPQETGNRSDTRFVTLSDNKSEGFSVIGCPEFQFSYHDFTLTDLTKARHLNELEKSEHNYLYIDYKMRGLGSNSCGPEPEEEYEFRPHSFRFAFVMKLGCTHKDTLKYARLKYIKETKRLSDDYCQKAVVQNKTGQNFDCRE